MSEFFQELRCKHFMVPEWCDWCVTDVKDNVPVAEHVRERVLASRGHAYAVSAVRRRERELRRAQPRKRQYKRTAQSTAALGLALSRKNVISPVFGKTFDLPIRTPFVQVTKLKK